MIRLALMTGFWLLMFWASSDAVKCHYRCQDHKSESDEFVITTHSDHVCEKETVQPRGDFRDWRSK